jgi:integrase
MPADRRAYRSLPIERWPETDRGSWERLFVRGGPLDEDGLRAGWCEQTRTTHAISYGRWLAFLAAIGELDPEEAPAARLTKERLRAYVEELGRSVGSVTVAGRIDHLSLVARSFDPEADFDWLIRLCRRLRARARPRARPELPRSREVYQAACRLMAGAEAVRGDVPRALRFRNGLVIAMLTAAPIRLRNLAMIEIGRHLTRRGEEYWLAFESHEMKGRRPFECPLPGPVGDAVDAYLRLHRPALLKSPSDRLLISLRGKPIHPVSLCERIRTTTRSILGAAMSPHRFRDMAATSIALEDPENVGLATPLLAHSSPAVTQKHYIRARQRDAARQVGDVVVALRRRHRRRARHRRPKEPA